MGEEENIGFRVSAVLPAAGCGERVGLPTPKQFCHVLSRPLISYTLEAFERVAWIEHVVVVVSPGKWQELEVILREFGHKKVVLTTGHSTRHRSILAGIDMLKQLGEIPDVVILHDAVRPFVDITTLRNVAEEAHQNGAAGVIRPLVSTVIGTDLEGFLEQSLDRSKFKASEMPQAFDYDIITSAYAKCTDYDLDYGTECLHVAQKYTGTKVRLVDGPSHLWKVTYKRDLYAAEGILKEQYNNVSIVWADIPTLIQETLEHSCRSRSLNVSFTSSRATLLTDDCVSCVMYVDARDSPEVVERLVEELPRHTRYTGGVILVSHKDAMNDFEKLVRKLASRLRASRHFVNGILINEDSDSQEQTLPSLADIVAELLFNRSLTLTGQTLSAF